jgi:hypothetical protein
MHNAKEVLEMVICEDEEHSILTVQYQWIMQYINLLHCGSRNASYLVYCKKGGTAYVKKTGGTK